MSLPDLKASAESLLLSTGYATREQQLARRYNTASPYLRLEDGLCRAFLQAGVYAPEFEGIKLLFPFVREAVVMRLPREQRYLVNFMYFAFYAGNDLGARHPELLPDILPDHELREARRRLGVIKTLSEQELGFGKVLRHAFERVVQSQLADTPPERLDAVYAEVALRTLRTGFAAATLAHFDPSLCDFYGPTTPDATRHFRSVLCRNWLAAPADSVGLSLIGQLEHPLLRVAGQFYSGRPTECAVVQGFIREHLVECGALSENDCPASDAELMDWIGAGMVYGRRVMREQPETMQRMLAEGGGKRAADALSAIQDLLADAGSLEPALLLPALKRWQKAVYDDDEPLCYGQSIERVALFADFAFWIPWGTSELASKTGNSNGNDDHEQSTSN